MTQRLHWKTITRSIWMTLATALVLAPGTAAAAPIVISQTQVLVAQGQDMTFVFNGLPATDGQGGTIEISTGGGAVPGLDLSGAFPLEDENFEVSFDGGSQGFFSCGGPSNNGSTPIPGATDNSGNFNDCVFSLPFALGGAALQALLADGSLSVGVLFGDDVSTFGHNDEVNVTLRYNSAQAPEPATLALLGIGLVGGAARRRFFAHR